MRYNPDDIRKAYRGLELEIDDLLRRVEGFPPWARPYALWTFSALYSRLRSRLAGPSGGQPPGSEAVDSETLGRELGLD